MGIELKTLIEDTCRQFEPNFSAGDLARLVSDYYHPDVLIVAEGIGRLEGHEGAFRYFGWAIAAYQSPVSEKHKRRRIQLMSVTNMTQKIIDLEISSSGEAPGAANMKLTESIGFSHGRLGLNDDAEHSPPSREG
jgi:ketosteroid isomerase-like protein